jgi:hypothetical protein
MSTPLPDAHQACLDRLLGRLQSDARIEAVLGGGSLVHGGFDAQSDLDLVIVVADAAYGEVMATRLLLAESLGDFITGFTGEHVGEPRLLICLYGPPLIHVDHKFIKADDLSHMVERPIILWARDSGNITQRLDAADIRWPNAPAEWFEARAWIWLHYGATKLQRGELWEAIAMLGFFREQVLGALLHRRAGRMQRGLRRIEQVAGSETLALTHAKHDAASVAAALKASAEIYLALRRDDPPQRPTPHMPEALWPYLIV